MKQTNKQHYVPKRYLKNFANAKKDVYRLNVFDKEQSIVRPNQNIEDIASENKFYDVDFDVLIKDLFYLQ